MSRRRVVISWSSGKDSAWLLQLLRRDASLELSGLLTTVSEESQRVATHGVRAELLAAQAESAGLPLWRIVLPRPCGNAEYETRMRAALAHLKREGVDAIAFGDLFLADIRAYRERVLSGTGIAPLFPLFGADTFALAREMLSAGLRATLACVDTAKLPAAFAGRAFDEALLRELPLGVDPCGEHGEFHTFAHGGPMFARELRIELAGTSVEDGFAFADLRLADPPARRVEAEQRRPRR